jgi:hypothetical protein
MLKKFAQSLTNPFLNQVSILEEYEREKGAVINTIKIKTKLCNE